MFEKGVKQLIFQWFVNKGVNRSFETGAADIAAVETVVEREEKSIKENCSSTWNQLFPTFWTIHIKHFHPPPKSIFWPFSYFGLFVWVLCLLLTQKVSFKASTCLI